MLFYELSQLISNIIIFQYAPCHIKNILLYFTIVKNSKCKQDFDNLAHLNVMDSGVINFIIFHFKEYDSDNVYFKHSKA